MSSLPPLPNLPPGYGWKKGKPVVVARKKSRKSPTKKQAAKARAKFMKFVRADLKKKRAKKRPKLARGIVRKHRSYKGKKPVKRKRTFKGWKPGSRWFMGPVFPGL